jgi:hypothetical protein
MFCTEEYFSPEKHDVLRLLRTPPLARFFSCLLFFTSTLMMEAAIFSEMLVLKSMLPLLIARRDFAAS